MARADSETGNHTGIRGGMVFRKPRRITVTVPDQIYRTLLERSTREGRSISNLAAYLLECAVGTPKGVHESIAAPQMQQPVPLAADRRLMS
jgi:hypothetical protein